MPAQFSSFAVVALVSAAIAIVLLVTYLVVRPPLTQVTQVWLLFGLGVFPIGVAVTGNVEGYQATEQRAFCGSCHVMGRHASDSNDLGSHSLASRHARNTLFGAENCYTCHADYGMYGTVLTKIGGMRHVWLYYTEYREIPLEEALKTIHIRRPYPNENCMQCHSTEVDLWRAVPDHRASLDEVRAGRISCASGGCHGFAHPFSKTAPEKERAAQTVHVDAGAASSEGGAP